VPQGGQNSFGPQNAPPATQQGTSNEGGGAAPATPPGQARKGGGKKAKGYDPALYESPPQPEPKVHGPGGGQGGGASPGG